MKKKFAILFVGIFLLSFYSCNNRSRFNEFKTNELSVDSTKLFITYKNTVFYVPSPQLINLYLKRIGIYPSTSIINPAQNIEKYTTSLKKAINLGIYGADLGYINLFSVSENTNEYLSAIDQLAKGLNLGLLFTSDVYNQIISLKDNQDSLAQYISDFLTNADNYLKANSQQQTGILVIAGGWIESFYILCNTYSHNKNIEIKNLIFQQKFVLENLIKGLAPYYESSSELQELIDSLVEIAYDFDMLDFKYTYGEPIFRYRKGVMIFDNNFKLINSEGSFETIIRKAEDLRNKQIS